MTAAKLKQIKHPTILIDIDDTIEYLCVAWCKRLNETHGTNISPNNITSWDISIFFPSLTKDEVFAPLHDDDFWKTVNPRPDAIKYVRKLFDDGYDIYLCTTTDYRNIKAKYEYVVKRYFPYITWNKIIVTSNKQMIKADFLIDDGVHNLENGDYKKILITAPHNQSYNAELNDMFRAENWEKAFDYIKSCTNQRVQ